MSDFWERCIAANCVIVPVKVYSEYIDGNEHESKFQGMRFAALGIDSSAVGPDYWFMIDESSSGLENLYVTAEDALKAYESKVSERQTTI